MAQSVQSKVLIKNPVDWRLAFATVQPIVDSLGRFVTWLGWTSISEEEIRAAERAADLDEQDVRDELGLSFLHFLYADRFFPGTSTQMTKLRYVLFVAAAYERLRQEARDGAPDELLPGLEWDIAVQLKEAVENAGQSLTRSGVIGWTVVDRSSRSGRGKVPKVLPSMSYFTALAALADLRHAVSVASAPGYACGLEDIYQTKAARR
ncbi:hypothetical protein ACVMII_005383 [Bradyrhizobium diazoefficiens]